MRMNRDDIIEGNRRRLEMRSQFKSEAAATGEYLRPKNVANRWKEKQKARFSDAKQNAGDFAKKNRNAIAAIGAGAFILASYRPVSKMIKRLKDRRAEREI